jgi:hypothetical protein
MALGACGSQEATFRNIKEGSRDLQHTLSARTSGGLRRSHHLPVQAKSLHEELSKSLQ